MASDYSHVEDRNFDESTGSKDPGFLFARMAGNSRGVTPLQV
jgi:hypothetical protein